MKIVVLTALILIVLAMVLVAGACLGIWFFCKWLCSEDFWKHMH